MDEKRRVECHLHKGGGTKKGETIVLGGVVYIKKSTGPRTEPSGTFTGIHGREIITFNMEGVRSQSARYSAGLL